MNERLRRAIASIPGGKIGRTLAALITVTAGVLSIATGVTALWPSEGTSSTSGAPTTSTASPLDPVTEIPGLSERRLEKYAISILNDVRDANLVPVIPESFELTRKARAHSARMARTGRLDHPANLGFGKNRFAAQNIALVPGCDRDTVITAIKAFAESEAHKQNIVSRQFRAIGVGVAQGDSCEQSYMTVNPLG